MRRRPFRVGGARRSAAAAIGVFTSLLLAASSVLAALPGAPAPQGATTLDIVTGIATAIAVGGSHSCAILTGGSIACWGDNLQGDLGNGTKTRSTAPVAVSGVTSATAIAAGSEHSCAIVSGGAAVCWGDNTSGALGNGLSGPSNSSSIPVPVSGITGATSIAAGAYVTCALISGGSVKCWGYNAFGELGNPTGLGGFSATPVAVTGITTAIAIAVRQDHACAVLSGGTVKCWGADHYGQLGDGTSGPTDYSATPLTVKGIVDAIGIAAEGNASCALLRGGRIDCWGSNSSGELGNGTTTNSLAPVAVSGITSATAVAGGLSAVWGTTCAVMTGGGIDCWGRNGGGELGNGSSSPYSDIPVAVSGIRSARAVATDFEHTCAVLADGGVACWGLNTYGQLGAATTPYSYSLTPVAVIGLGPSPTVPGRPSGVAAVAGNGQATVSWTGPASTGGAPIDAYRVTSSPGGRTCTTVTHSCTVSGLTNGEAYTFTVAAHNSKGSGAASDPSAPVTPAAPVVVRKPDGRIRLGTNGALRGNNIYNTSGASQSRTGSARKGKTITFTISIQNDGTAADSFRLKATGTVASGYTVKYFSGTTNITAKVLKGTFKTASLAAARTVLVTVKVTIKRSAKASSKVTRLVTITSVSSSSKKDAVKLIAKRS